MTSMETLATFFGWCAVINIGILLTFISLMSILNKDGFIINLSLKVFGNTKADTLATIFRVFQQFRFFVIGCNIVPYVSLKLML
ncbi:MAG: hypothetical protein K0U93_17355 [Gammaproteobacteria bacterium]|nr:hypothetical protein [Gammaproteobacteria bacterium]